MDRTLPLDAHRGAADDVFRDAAEAYGAQDYARAEHGWSLTRDYFAANGHTLDAAGAAVGLGDVLWDTGRGTEAGELYAEALEVYRTAGLPRQVAGCLMNLGL